MFFLMRRVRWGKWVRSLIFVAMWFLKEKYITCYSKYMLVLIIVHIKMLKFCLLHFLVHLDTSHYRRKKGYDHCFI